LERNGTTQCCWVILFEYWTIKDRMSERRSFQQMEGKVEQNISTFKNDFSDASAFIGKEILMSWKSDIRRWHWMKVVDSSFTAILVLFLTITSIYTHLDYPRTRILIVSVLKIHPPILEYLLNFLLLRFTSHILFHRLFVIFLRTQYNNIFYG
jgi:hypothetical protein